MSRPPHDRRHPPDETTALKVGLVDPGDFTPAYDLALGEGLIANGIDLELLGRAGFDEGPRPAWRSDWFYRPLASPLVRGLPAPVARLVKGATHGLDMWRLARRLDQRPLDLVHFQWLPLPLLDQWLLAPLACRVPLILTVHDSLPYNGAASAAMRVGHRRVMERFDVLIVHTAAARDRLLAEGFPAARVRIVPHGLLHGEVVQERRPRPPGAPLRLLQLGKIKPYKGVDVLLQALHRLSAEDRAGLRVRIVGRPYLDADALRREVTALGLGGTVELELAFVSDVQLGEELASADLALFPYRSIDASGVAMAALAAGLPMLASAVGMFTDLLADGRAGMLAPPGDPDALANALRRLVREPDLVEKLWVGVRAKRMEVPTWSSIGAMTREIYQFARAGWLERTGRSAGAASVAGSAAVMER